MLNTFAIVGKSQPLGRPRQAVVYVKSAEKTALTKCLKRLRLVPFSGKSYTLVCPDKIKKSALFLNWHGVYALFYVEADDVTVVVPLTDIPRTVKIRKSGAK
jgi:hypothetical protein